MEGKEGDRLCFSVTDTMVLFVCTMLGVAEH